MWTLANVKTDLDNFLGSKRFQLLGGKTQSVHER